MAKLTLVPEPVFKAPVPIPVPGGEPVDVVFVFKYKDQDELQEFRDRVVEKSLSNVDVIMEICCDWEGIEQEFSRESVELFDRKWHGGAIAVTDTYTQELRGARRKK